jgi:hypothetical protein
MKTKKLSKLFNLNLELFIPTEDARVDCDEATQSQIQVYIITIMIGAAEMLSINFILQILLNQPI